MYWPPIALRFCLPHVAFTLMVLPALAEEQNSPLRSPAVAQVVASALAGRRLDESRTWPGGAHRGLRDIFRDTASAVPLVISKQGIGSAVLIAKDSKTGTAFFVTNEHVVASPFEEARTNVRFVVLLLYEPTLAKTVFDQSWIAACVEKPKSSPS